MFTLLLIVALMTGFTLGRAFRSSIPVATTLALVVSTVVVVLGSVSAGIYLGYELWQVLLAQVATAPLLQFGFLLGLGSGDVVSRLRNISSSTVERESRAPARK